MKKNENSDEFKSLGNYFKFLHYLIALSFICIKSIILKGTYEEREKM